MKAAFYFQLLLNLFFIAILVAIGASAFSYPITADYFHTFFANMQGHSWVIPFTGVILLCIALWMGSWTVSLLRKGHFETVAGKTMLSIQEGIFDKTLKTFWKQKFANPDLSCHALLRNNQLHIIAEVPMQEAPSEHDLYEELRELLAKKLGYAGNFSVSFFS